MFGDGHLAITLDPTAGSERYQGIVPLEGASLAEAAELYFFQSEQLPTLLKIAVRWDEARGWVGGGLLVQHLARAEIGGERLAVADMHPDWSHVLALASTMTDAELTDLSLCEEELVWRLFHDEEVRVFPGPVPTRGCRCTLAHIAGGHRPVPARRARRDGRRRRPHQGRLRLLRAVVRARTVSRPLAVVLLSGGLEFDDRRGDRQGAGVRPPRADDRL